MIELKRKVVQLLNRKPKRTCEEFKRFQQLTNFYHKKTDDAVTNINDAQTLVKACALLQKALSDPTLPEANKKPAKSKGKPKKKISGYTNNLRAMKYDDFLRSDHWHQTKERARIMGLYKQCHCCKITKVKLDLHHLSYRHRGTIQERRDCKSLVAVCNNCHTAIHNYQDEYKVSIRMATAIIKKMKTI